MALIGLAAGWCYSGELASVKLAQQKAAAEAQIKVVQAENRAFKALADSLKATVAARDGEIRRSHRRELTFQSKLDSLEAVNPPELAPVSCFPFVEQLNTCKQIVTEVRAQRDSAQENATAERIRANAADSLARKNRATADSLLKAAAHPKRDKLLWVLPKPPTWVILLGGVLIGSQL